MKTDRELLELAAKAAGIAVEPNINGWDEAYPIGWNPLTSDGDALRLALYLNILVQPDLCGQSYANNVFETINEHGGSVYVASRRAIVRAAAEIAEKEAK